MTAKSKKLGLTFAPKTHRYRLDGKPVPSVTGIIGKGLPKPALSYWAAREVATYAANNLAAVEQMVADMGVNSAIAALKGVPWNQRDKAAVRGTDVHEYAERIAKGETVDVPAELAGYVQGAVAFLDEHDVEPVVTEVRGANRKRHYAGTCDMVARIDGDTWLLDWKTSKGVYGDYALQLAAYAFFEFYMNENGVETPFPSVDRIGVVHLREDGYQLVEFPDLQRAYDAFLAVKAVADMVPEIEKWVK